jgi:hypothetical protein
MGMLDILEQRRRHLFHGEHVIHEPGGDGAAWHPVVLRGVRALDHRQAALRLDRLEPEGAVAAGARDDDADGALLLVLRQAPQEAIDGPRYAGTSRRRPEMQDAPLDRQQRVRRDDVDVLGLDQRPIVRLFDRHGGMPAQQLWQVAHMGGIEMRDHHKTEAALGRHGAEESLQCLEPPGRGTDRDYREVPWVTFPGLISIGTGVCRRARRRGASARLQVIGRRLLSVSFCHARIRIV